MKIVGTIVEYNPLHNGHIYALNEIKKLSQADIIVAVLSGNFTMRGDLSIFDKFEKTRQALKAGIDLVIELPFVCTVQNADKFAQYAVKLLQLARVNELWIGSEMNDPTLYEKYYQSWKNSESQEKIKELLNQGYSYKEASASIIDLPSNDLLGFSYYKAIKEQNFNIQIHTILRKGNYNSLEITEFPSAYAIRNNLTLMDKHCPSYLDSSKIRNKDLLFSYLKYRILSTSTKELKEIFLIEEGLENRLKDVSSFYSIEEFIESLSTKRYTKSRIQRILAYTLMNIKKEDMPTDLNFLRVLGYSNQGQEYLKTIKKETAIYTNIKEGIHPILDLELKVTKLLDMIYSTSTFQLEQGKPQELKK